MRITDLPISIHALREEGDFILPRPNRAASHFYPRPPRGGRRTGLYGLMSAAEISIHALREEGDRCPTGRVRPFSISIHALREEGDIPPTSL